MHRPTTRCHTIALTAILAAGCVPLPGGRDVSRRMVARKEGENTLVSDDGATCRVKDDVYGKVEVGDRHACVWKNVGFDAPADPAAPRATPDRTPRRAPARPSGG